MDIPVLQWLLDFIGANNGYNDFSTRMYNFWSGFGSNISVLASIGAVFGVYRHNLKRLESLNPLHYVHKKDKDNVTIE